LFFFVLATTIIANLRFSVAQEGSVSEGSISESDATAAPPTFIPTPSLANLPPEIPVFVTATATQPPINPDLQPAYEGQFNESVQPLPRLANPPPNLLSNGDFSQLDQNGKPLHWGTWGTDNSGITLLPPSQVTNGVFEFYRQSNANSAAVLQATGDAVQAFHGINLQFSMGNSSNQRKRVTVILHSNASFTDQQTCVFWMNPNQVNYNYSMVTYTPTNWTDVHVSIYEAAVNLSTPQPWVRLDNVVLYDNGTTSLRETQCIDPNAPPPAPYIWSPNGVTNGTFSQAIQVTPPCIHPCWQPIDTTWQIQNGILEFRRGGSGHQLFQGSVGGFSSTNSGGLEFQAYFGNSSSTRQRLSVIIHNSNWTNLLFCSFWLEANTPLSLHAIRAGVNRGWGDINLSIYDSTGSSAPNWIRMDNVRLAQNWGSLMRGVLCDALPGADIVNCPAGMVERANVCVQQVANKYNIISGDGIRYWSATEYIAISDGVNQIGRAFNYLSNQTITSWDAFNRVMLENSGTEILFIRGQQDDNIIEVNNYTYQFGNQASQTASFSYGVTKGYCKAFQEGVINNILRPAAVVCNGELISHYRNAVFTGEVDQYTVIHELGHIFDYRSNYGISNYFGFAVGTISDCDGDIVLGVLGTWTRGRRGWGTGPAQYTGSSGNALPLITDFQQNSDNSTIEAAADLFLNWVYRFNANNGVMVTNSCIQTPRPSYNHWTGSGFLNREWSAAPHPTFIADSRGITGLQDERLPGDARFFKTDQRIRALFTNNSW